MVHLVPKISLFSVIFIFPLQFSLDPVTKHSTSENFNRHYDSYYTLLHFFETFVVVMWLTPELLSDSVICIVQSASPSCCSRDPAAPAWAGARVRVGGGTVGAAGTISIYAVARRPRRKSRKN